VHPEHRLPASRDDCARSELAAQRALLHHPVNRPVQTPQSGASGPEATDPPDGPRLDRRIRATMRRRCVPPEKAAISNTATPTTASHMQRGAVPGPPPIARCAAAQRPGRTRPELPDTRENFA
jgi:hypothetical protein